MSDQVYKESRREFLGFSALALSGAVIGVPTMAYAEDNTINGFTPVYRGAITQNEPGRVNVHPVTYKLHGLDIAANVYTPANYNPQKKYPAIVVAHPNGGVKEQVAGLYAQRLAEQGYHDCDGRSVSGWQQRRTAQH